MAGSANGVLAMLLHLLAQSEQLSIFGAGSLSVQIQGSYVVGVAGTDFTYTLNPNDTLIISYTGTPTIISYWLS